MDERIQKYFYHELSRPERVSFLHEVERNQKLKQQFTEYQNMYALLNLSPQLQDHHVGELHYNKFMCRTQRDKIRNRCLLWTKYAAAIILIMLTSGYFTYQFISHRPSDLTADAGMNILYTPAGQRARLVLQDGTEVWLNAKSSLTYPARFVGGERRVKVEGEAFFHVSKDASKPFFVSASGIDIKVLGTQFNVYGYFETGIVQASLLEGSVHVFYPGKEKEGVVLQPNQQVTVEKGKMRVESIPFAGHFLWREGIYAFEEEPLIHILKKMELYYDVNIILEDTTLFEDLYTCKFRQRDSLDDVFRILQQVHPFHIKKDLANNRIILSK